MVSPNVVVLYVVILCILFSFLTLSFWGLPTNTNDDDAKLVVSSSTNLPPSSASPTTTISITATPAQSVFFSADLSTLDYFASLPPPRPPKRHYPNASAVFKIHRKNHNDPAPRPLVFTLVVAHAGPAKDLRNLLRDLNITLHVIHPWSPLGPDGHTLKYHLCGSDPLPPGSAYRFTCPFDEAQFELGEGSLYEAYKHWEPFAKADLFICGFDAVFCSILRPFNRPMLIMSAFRLDGHLIPHDRVKVAPVTSRQVQVRLAALARHPKVVFSCTNLYDCFYTQHFLGIRRLVPLLAVGKYAVEQALINSTCRRKGVYSPIREDEGAELLPFLIAPKKIRPTGEVALKNMKAIDVLPMLKKASEVLPAFHAMCDLGHMASGYVIMPYSVHSYFIVELATMGLPLFAPSLGLLRNLHLRYHILNERTVDSDRRMEHSYMITHPRSFSKTLDPNNDMDARPLDYWLQFCDWYAYGEGVKYFRSGVDLAEMLRNATAASLFAMHLYARARALERDREWKLNMMHIVRLLRLEEEKARPADEETVASAIKRWQKAATASEGRWDGDVMKTCVLEQQQPNMVFSLAKRMMVQPATLEFTQEDHSNHEHQDQSRDIIRWAVLQASCANAKHLTFQDLPDSRMPPITFPRSSFWYVPFVYQTPAGYAWARRMEWEIYKGASPNLDFIVNEDLRRFVRTWARGGGEEKAGFYDEAYELAVDLQTMGLTEDLSFSDEVKQWFVLLGKHGYQQPVLQPGTASLRFRPDQVQPPGDLWG